MGSKSIGIDTATVGRRALLTGGTGLAAAAAVGLTAAPASATGSAQRGRNQDPGGHRGRGGPHPHHDHRRPKHPATLWRDAAARGITFGTSTSTWQLDPQYSALVAEQAAILFTEDDLLWWRIKPSPDAPLDYSYADQFYAFAEQNRQLVFAAHLVWDEGFGDGWSDDDLWGLDRKAASKLLYGTLRSTVTRYRGRTAGWIVANEVTDPEGDRGLRTDVPWYNTIGPDYVAQAFRRTRALDRHAVLVLNEFGFETTNEWGDDPVARQKATLQVIDRLLADRVPVDALGIQAHLLAPDFADRFDRRQYRRFLAEVAARGLDILITEMDVKDDGLPADIAARDRGVAQIYRRYLDTALSEPAVKAVMCFGLSDRYTWLEEDTPRDDGVPRRPLAYDEDMHPKPARRAIARALHEARPRRPLWRPRRHC